LPDTVVAEELGLRGIDKWHVDRNDGRAFGGGQYDRA
jgi:hypothetical protein